MQPYFAPYVGYFDLIRRCDQWIVFDSAQYIRHGWVNRNRILHPTKEEQYVIVPLQKHTRETSIKDIEIVPGDEWRSRIRGQLQHYRGKAPHFPAVADLVSSVLDLNTSSLVHLNVWFLRQVCLRLGIPFNFQIFSEMKLALPKISEPGHWALEISTALGATEYLNPPGGSKLFNAAEFSSRGITLTIQEPIDFVYTCPGYPFVEGLSIIDVMMWNSPEEIIHRLERDRPRSS